MDGSQQDHLLAFRRHLTGDDDELWPLLGRLLLAALAANTAIIGGGSSNPQGWATWFIALNNALIDASARALPLDIGGLLAAGPLDPLLPTNWPQLGADLLLSLVVLSVLMLVFLLWLLQMLVRLALLDVLLALAPLALGLLVCLIVALHVIPATLLSAPSPALPGLPGEAPAPPAHPAAIFAEVEGRTGVPAALLTALAFVESRFDPAARGPLIARFAGTEDAHALGLMQFLPGAYRALDPRVDALTGVRLGELRLWHPRHAAYAAALYLRDHGAPVDLRRALHAYSHDDAYVERVLALAARYAASATGGDVAARALAHARTQLGTPYVWGGADERGFDCSGLVQWAYAAAGVRLPRTAEAQYHATQRVARAELRPGDLVFFCCDPGQSGVAVSHVGLYAGDGRMLDAPAPGAVVRLKPLWRGSVGAGRVTGPRPGGQ